MGRPLNKRYFGTSTIGTEIEVKFFNGTADVVGYIVAQKGTKKFRCSDGTDEAVCWLKWDGTANIAGEMSIGMTDDAGAADFVRKISGHKATLAGGDVVGWEFTANVADDDRGTIDESDGYVEDEPISITAAVNGTDYVIMDAGDSDFTLIGAADSEVGTVFTATGPGVGTGTIAEQA